jgi:hypothetical protein
MIILLCVFYATIVYSIERRVQTLNEKNSDNQYIIKAKLLEKDEEIQNLKNKQEKFEQLLQSLIESGQLRPKPT